MTSEIDRKAYLGTINVRRIEGTEVRLHEEFISVSSDWELFLDRRILNDVLPRSHNVNETLHQPVKYEGNPVFMPEMTWEGTKCPVGSYPHDFAFYGGTIYDEEERIFKMWYTGTAGGIQNNWVMCYATSGDGIQWKRPTLKMIEYNGSKENNICFESLDEAARKRGLTKGIVLVTHHFNGVVKDPDDPARRYKTVSMQGGMPDPETGKTHPTPKTGLYTSVSPDGIHWTTRKEPIFVNDDFEFGLCDVTTLWHNRKRKKYVLLMKGHIYQPWGTGDQGPYKRVQQLSESDDFEHWTTPVLALKPDDQDPDDMHVYGMTGFNYENMYLGLFMAFRSDNDKRNMDIQLVSSRDGRSWWRAGNRRTFIPLGEPGTWDSGEVFTCRPPIELGDELWFYYSGVPGPRSHFPLVAGEPPRGNGCIGLAKLKKGRFVSMDAGSDEGWLLTKPLKLKDKTLHVNADASRGYLLVEIMDVVQQKPIRFEPQFRYGLGGSLPGFSRWDCNLMTVDRLDHVVTWQGNSDISRLQGKDVILRFILCNAELYGFRTC